MLCSRKPRPNSSMFKITSMPFVFFKKDVLLIFKCICFRYQGEISDYTVGSSTGHQNGKDNIRSRL